MGVGSGLQGLDLGGGPASPGVAAMIAATPVGAVKLRAARAVAWFGAALLVMVWVVIYASLSSERTRILADTRADTANLARAFDEHIQRTIAGLDQTLLYLRAEFQQAPERFDLNRSVANNVILKRVSVQIARIGADGVLADSNVLGFTRMDLSDREHFRVHKVARKDELFISKPVLGRASGKWSIQLTRRLEDGQGNFAGVLVISLDPNYLGEIYGSVDVGENGAIAVIGTDGVVRVASHGGGGFLGQSLQGGAILETVRRQEAATLESHGPLDDTDRIISLRPLPNLPLSVLVGRAKAEAMAVYDRSVSWHLLIGAAVTLALGAALVALYRMVRAQEAIAADLAVKKAELLASRVRLRRYVADLERIAEVAAHDLQEPLRRVVAYAQLLSSHVASALDDEGRGYVAHVVDGAQRMRKLVKDLEAFVAVDQIPDCDGEVAVSTAVSTAMDRLADQIRSAGATIVVDPLPSALVDERALAEIFTQLLDNSIRYRCASRKPLIHVSAHSEGDYLVFSVRDNGAGIDPRDRIRLFEIFHRLEGIDGGGTGIGLAIVRRMVEHMGGKVWVESTLGEGSSFSFSLPRRKPMHLSVVDGEIKAAE